ncbi:MAG: site-specific DNA-methyltransferase [Mariniphaga sp.]
MNKPDLIQKIKQLEGISQEERSYLINLVNTKKKYGLVWEDKPEDVEEQLRTQLPVLQEVVEKRIKSLPPAPPKEGRKKTALDLQQSLFEPDDTVSESSSPSPLGRAGVGLSSSLPLGEGRGGASSPNHILIEGDNLHALTALTFTHEGKIDVIYIDPPYNTGNKDFKYNDSFVDREDSYRHSKWLSFMDKRLRLAKRLLSDKGVVFISIDDNEQAQLKLLCDEIFSEINCLGPIIQNKQNAKNDSVNIQKNHEFIIVYRKACIFSGTNKIIPSLINSDFKTKNIYIENNRYYYLNDSITTRGEGGILNARPNLGHTIYFHPNTNDKIAVCDYDIDLAKVSNDPKEVYSIDSELISKGYIPIRPPNVRGKLGCWTWSKEKVNDEKQSLVVTGKERSYTVKKRTFVEQNEVYEENGKLYFKSYEESNSRSIVDYSTNDGTDILNEILNVSGKFNNPKNLEMLKYFIGLFPLKDPVILDFFAGSGTTLHATMQLNAEDGGNRQCILVTNNENNICEEVTYERNRRVIQGYTNSKGEWVNGLTNNNLRYYKSGFVGREPSLKNKMELTRLATELLCIKENCYDEQETAFKQSKLFANSKVMLLILFDDTVIPEAVEFIKKQINGAIIKVYVFSMGSDPYTEDFYEVSDKIELCALPDAIYKAYRSVLPKNKRPTGIDGDDINEDEPVD